MEAQRDKYKVHFATVMYMCHLKHADLEPKFQKYTGRIVLRGDKDDSGAFAVFTEQGSSASQMTAAKVMDVMARPPDCDGQAADAVSAKKTQVKMEDAPRLLRISVRMSLCIYGYVFHDTSGQNPGQTLQIQWFLSNEICTGTHLLVSCVKDSSRKF